MTDHTLILTDGTPIDPLGIIDAANPQPIIEHDVKQKVTTLTWTAHTVISMATVDWKMLRLEFVTALRNLYSTGKITNFYWAPELDGPKYRLIIVEAKEG